MDIPPHETESLPKSRSISLVEIGAPKKPIKKGSPQKTNGNLSFQAFEEGFNWARQGLLHALVTAPISKKSWTLAGIRWPGHTEYLSQYYPKAIMFFWSKEFRVALVSHHVSLRKALERIERNALLHFFLRLQDSMPESTQGRFQFLVAGLNPHAGEEGLMGSEEEEEIKPAVLDAKNRGMPISGPYPPDVVFRKARENPQSIVIALYHDQGLIPFKLISFEEGVNITLGLPFIRTSPDHGTAFDIAGKGEANPQSMIEAIKLAFLFSPLF